MTDADLIRAKLNQVRRRQFLSLLLNSTGVAVLVSVLLCAVEWFAWRRLTVTVYAISGIALLSAAFIFSILKRPSWKSTAKLMDQALLLQQRVETSWECMPPRDEIDYLLLRDTNRRLSSVQVSEICPIRFDRTARISLLACVLAVSGLGVVRILQSVYREYNRRTAGEVQIAAGSVPQSKRDVNSPRTQNDRKASSSVGYETSSESNRSSARTDSSMQKLGESQSLQPAQGSPASSAADKGAANNPEQAGATGRGSLERANAGGASIRKAEKQEGAESGLTGASGANANSEDILKSAQTSSPGRKALSGFEKEIASRDDYSENLPALSPALEQALSKEKYPPGLKKYIADYFRAIQR